MAAGLAIVASDLPTQAGVVRESNTGLVVADFTPEAHADAICRLLDDAELRKRFQVSGKEAAKSRYTWETERLKLQRLYRKLGGAIG
jgi:glycosyltransferase involved in cell wall biosynthesis